MSFVLGAGAPTQPLSWVDYQSPLRSGVTGGLWRLTSSTFVLTAPFLTFPDPLLSSVYRFSPFSLDTSHKKLKMAKDLLHPSSSEEKKKHKLKRLIQSPNSFFMDVKCPGCFHITTVFSHAQTLVLCAGCASTLSKPTGGKCRLTEGCSFRKKVDN